MSELDDLEDLVEPAPPGLDPQAWSRMSLGFRTRILRGHHFLFPLEKARRQRIEKLPNWIRYGPEHGLPVELFNADDFLLPKYRPGGGLHSEFREWRRRYRTFYTIHESVDVRIRELKHRYGFVAGLPLGIVVLSIGAYFGARAERGVIEYLWSLGSILTLAIILKLGPWALGSFLRWMALRRMRDVHEDENDR